LGVDAGVVVGEPLSRTTSDGTLGDAGLSERAKLVAAIPSGINTTADRAAIRREKAMP